MRIYDNDAFFQVRLISAIFVLGLCFKQIGYMFYPHNLDFPVMPFIGKFILFVCCFISVLYMGGNSIYIGSRGFYLDKHNEKIKYRVFMLPYLIYSILAFPMKVTDLKFSNETWFILLVIFTIIYVLHIIIEWLKRNKNE